MQKQCIVSCSSQNKQQYSFQNTFKEKLSQALRFRDFLCWMQHIQYKETPTLSISELTASKLCTEIQIFLFSRCCTHTFWRPSCTSSPEDTPLTQFGDGVPCSGAIQQSLDGVNRELHTHILHPLCYSTYGVSDSPVKSESLHVIGPLLSVWDPTGTISILVLPTQFIGGYKGRWQ